MSAVEKKTILPEWLEWSGKVKLLRDELEPLNRFNGRALDIYKELAELRKNIPPMFKEKS